MSRMRAVCDLDTPSPVGCQPVRPTPKSAMSGSRRGSGAGTEEAEEPAEGVVVAVDDALFEGNDGVVGDGDALGADLGAALRDVAEPDPLSPHQVLGAV